MRSCDGCARDGPPDSPPMRRLLLLSFIWGWSFLFIKVGVEGLTPIDGGRRARGPGRRRPARLPAGASASPCPRDRRMWGHFVVVGLVGSALPFTMLAWGEERITSALTSVLNASTPLFTALFAAALLGDRLRSVQVVGLLVGIVGRGRGRRHRRRRPHRLVARRQPGRRSLAGACYGLGFTWSKRHLMGIPPIVAAAGQLTAATILLAPVRDHHHRDRRAPTSPGAGSGPSSLLGVVGTGVAYVLNYRIIAELGATRASLVTYIIPVVAVAVGIVVLDEPFGWRIVAGGVLIIAGIFLVNGTGGRAAAAGAAARWRPRSSPACWPAAAGAAAAGRRTVGATRCAPSRSTASTSCTCSPARPTPSYRTDPPTSGPHQPTPPSKAWSPSRCPARCRSACSRRAGCCSSTTGCPRPTRRRSRRWPAARWSSPPTPTSRGAAVVATAWVTKQTCEAFDRGAARGVRPGPRRQGPRRRLNPASEGPAWRPPPARSSRTWRTCPERDSNPHALSDSGLLKPPCLAIPSSGRAGRCVTVGLRRGRRLPGRGGPACARRRRRSCRASRRRGAPGGRAG